MRNERFTAWLLALALLISWSVGWAGDKKKNKKESAAAPHLEERQRAMHALNRFTFGPRPGDVDAVMRMGVDKWFDRQLHPEKIDDSALEARLSPFKTLNMDARTMIEKFPPPQVIKQVADGKRAMPSDPVERAIYQDQVMRYQERQDKKGQAGNTQAANATDDAANAGDPSMLTEDQRAARREAHMYAEENAQKLMQLPPDKRMKAVLAMTPEQRRSLITALRPEERQQLLDSFPADQRENLIAMANPQAVIQGELMQAKVLRAAYSERQLQEVLTDFWFNHFNVFIGKGADRYLINDYEREVIRPHVLGKFKDLLVATAKSPAMMFYLDNWQSVGPDSQAALGGPRRFGQNNRRFGQRRFPQGGLGQGSANGQPQANQNQQQKRGLNENYARELMELHTLGVDGGYTQKDVTEVARVFTGWTIRAPRQGGGFDYNDRMHEPGAKMVLGAKIKEDGQDEGMRVLDMLAHNPSTAKFISRKLAMRFVSDNPPQTLVDRMAKTFLSTDGDIREVLRTMFHSPEFWSPDVYHAKVKTPLEFVASAIRASGADVNNAASIVQALNRMGMPLYGAQPPTGYSMKAETWVNSAALLNRMNFALQFAVGRLPGTQFDAQRVLGPTEPTDPDAALALLENSLLAGDVSRQTHDTIKKQLDDPQVTGRTLDDPSRPPNIGAIAGLLLGSPEFQKR